MNMDILAKPAVLAICVIALVAAALYAVVDSPDELRTIGRTEIELQPSTSDGTERKAASVTSLIVGLEARLVENPDDAKGWLLLAKSHDHLGQQIPAN
jgi:cytochrome c-type biogenesis protein CcmH/NrfG